MRFPKARPPADDSGRCLTPLCRRLIDEPFPFPPLIEGRARSLRRCPSAVPGWSRCSPRCKAHSVRALVRLWGLLKSNRETLYPLVLVQSFNRIAL